DALVRGAEGRAAVLAQVVPPGRDAEVHAASIAEDGVHAEAAVAGLPLPGVLVVRDALHHLPGIAAIAAPEERGRLDAAPEVLPVVAGLERPDVGERAPVLLRECRR